MKSEYIIIKDKISKDKIIKMIPEFSKLVEEYGLDCEWYQHLENLYERLTLKEIKMEEDNITEYSNNMITLGFNSNQKKRNKNTLLTNNSSTNLILNNKNNSNKDIKNSGINTNNNILNINNESLGGKSFSNYSLINKINDINNINVNDNNEENNIKKFINNNTHNIKIILDKNFDVTFTLKKIGTIYFYIVDLYEKLLYKSDNRNQLIYEPKAKYSFRNKRFYEEESFGLIDKNNENNKFIKAKTLFSKKSPNKKNLPDLGNVRKELIDENIPEYDNAIQTVKTWASENNSINIKEHLIKERERIFNKRDRLKRKMKKFLQIQMFMMKKKLILSKIIGII